MRISGVFGVVVVVVVLVSFGFLCEASFDSWKGQTIYQIVTDRFNSTKTDDRCYGNNVRCGGNWKTLASRISYIRALNVDAIGISPIELNTKLGWHGYFPADWTKLDSRFGKDDDLQNLINVCQSNHLKIIVDVNLNHAGIINAKDLGNVDPFDDSDDYHDYCTVSAQETDLNKLAECRISYGDPSNQKFYFDLDQDNSEVRDDLVARTEEKFSEYSFDGIRIPFGINIDSWFLTYLRNEISPFMSLQVVYPTNKTNVDDIVTAYARYSYITPTIMNYPLYMALRSAFSPNGGSLKVVSDTLKAGFHYADPDLVINFIDNDDTTRFLFYVDENINFLKNALR